RTALRRLGSGVRIPPGAHCFGVQTKRMTEDERYLRRALELAAEAQRAGDVPIGALLVSGDLVLEAKNEKEAQRDATAHAEMLLLREGARQLGAWRLSDA